MKATTHIVMFLACLLTLVSGHIYRDNWMETNGIDPDYMHHKAMAIRSKAFVIQERIKVDDISAKRLKTRYDFGGKIAEVLPNI